MAVTVEGIRYISSDVEESFQGRRYQIHATTQMQVQYSLTDTVAERKGPADALDAVWGSVRVPQINDFYRYNSNTMTDVFCVDRKCKQRGIEHYHLFDITLQYESWLDSGGYELNPFMEPTRYSYAFAQFQKAIKRDIGNNYIKDSAGSMYNDIPTIDDSRPVITVKRNESSFPIGIATLYQDAVNTDVVRINGNTFPVGTLKVQNITSGDPQTRQGIDFYAVTYTLEYRREGWAMLLIDEGFFYLSGGVRKQAVDPADNRTPSPTPVLLDGAGGRMAVGGTPTFLSYDVYKQKALSPLGL